MRKLIAALFIVGLLASVAGAAPFGKVMIRKPTQFTAGMCAASEVVKKNAGNTAWECAADADSAGAPEGTAVLSTGEVGGTKFLREDGDGTSSWQAAAGGGSGSMTTIKINDVQLGGADIVTLDFDGTDFSGAETPDTEIQITIDDDGHNHTATSVSGLGTADISGLDISDDTNLAVTAPVVLTDDTLSITQNAGTDITADLEEETHASEHLADAADEIFGESLGTACTINQIWKSDGDGTVSCGADADTGGAPEGTAVLSTGEVGGTKFLREDGDGTSSWQTVAGGSGTGYMFLDVQTAKLSGDFIVDGTMAIDAGEGAWRLLSDATADEYALWQFRVPSTYSSAPVAKILYSMTSATSGNVEFEIDIMAVADGEAVNTASFDTVNSSGTVTVPGTAGLLDSISIALTNNDSMAAGELLFFRLARDATTDTASGDAEVVGLTLEWTE